MKLDVIETLREKADKRYDEFKIKEDTKSLIDNISDDAYIQKPIWIWGDKEYVALFIDLNDSTQISNQK